MHTHGPVVQHRRVGYHQIQKTWDLFGQGRHSSNPFGLAAVSDSSDFHIERKTAK